MTGLAPLSDFSVALDQIFSVRQSSLLLVPAAEAKKEMIRCACGVNPG